MDLPNATQHQVSNGLPDASQETASVAAISHRDHAVLDFTPTTHTGSHLELHLPQSLFDALCARLGNAIMTCDKIELERGLSNNPRITVSPSTAA